MNCSERGSDKMRGSGLVFQNGLCSMELVLTKCGEYSAVLRDGSQWNEPDDTAMVISISRL